MPEPDRPTVAPVMLPVMLTTLQAYVLGRDEAKDNVGVFPLHTVDVVLEVITGRELTVTVRVAGAPRQAPEDEEVVSVTWIVTGVIVPKSTLMAGPDPLGVAPVTTQE